MPLVYELESPLGQRLDFLLSIQRTFYVLWTIGQSINHIYLRNTREEGLRSTQPDSMGLAAAMAVK